MLSIHIYTKKKAGLVGCYIYMYKEKSWTCWICYLHIYIYIYETKAGLIGCYLHVYTKKKAGLVGCYLYYKEKAGLVQVM